MRFLFPELTGFERHLLTSLRLARFAVMIGYNAPDAISEEKTHAAEQEFMDAKTAVLEAGIRGRVTRFSTSKLELS